MREERKSAPPNAVHLKNRRKTVSIEEKLDVASRLDKAERIVDTYCNVRFAHKCVRTVRDNANRTAENAKLGPEVLLV
jgi:hypothetical protein